MFVTHSKRRLGSENYKQISDLRKTGVIGETAPLNEIKTANNNVVKHQKNQEKPSNIASTLFRKYYLRGDFPVSISFSGAQRTLKWLADPKTIDLVRFLPLFIEGLTETEEPFTFIAEKTSLQAISANPDKLVEVLPEIVLPLKRALDSKNPRIVVRAIKVFQAMLTTKPEVAESLVPYYKNLLPCFSKHFNENKNIGHHIEYSQKDRDNIGDLIMETLTMLEAHGGSEAFAHIKYMIPVYQSNKAK